MEVVALFLIREIFFQYDLFQIDKNNYYKFNELIFYLQNYRTPTVEDIQDIVIHF